VTAPLCGRPNKVGGLTIVVLPDLGIATLNPTVSLFVISGRRKLDAINVVQRCVLYIFVNKFEIDNGTILWAQIVLT
jgi:hypothetical protein